MISLRSTCLNLVVEEFERFHLAFMISNDENQKRNFEFLQKTYTLELISRLSHKRKLKDKYLSFLLNIHLQFLDEEWFIDSRYRYFMQDIIYRLPNLTKVNLYYVCNDEILKKIAKFCPKIIEIEASYSSITDTGLKYLCKKKKGKVSCPNLKNMYIYCTNITDEGVKYLIKNLPSLEKTAWENVPGILYSLHKDDLHNFAELPKYNLIQLDLCNHCKLPYYDDLLKVCLITCPKLKVLKCSISHKEQINLFKSTNLEELSLFVLRPKRNIDLHDFLINNGCNLITLRVYKCIISVNVLITHFPKLQNLSIEDSILLDESNESPCNLHSLTTCSFCDIKADCETNKAVCLLLSSSPKLEYLDFNFCELSEDTKSYILKSCENNSLKEITFHSTTVGTEFLKNILSICLTLKTLTLKRCDHDINERKDLTEFVKMLPNKPYIYVDSFCINDYDYEIDIARFY